MKTAAREVKLLKKCLKGNSRAFAAIVAEYQDLICAITFSGTADLQQSEELAHQTFINAWENLSQLKDFSKFRPWLCTIARNNTRNFVSKRQRDIIVKAKPMEDINGMTGDESGPLESAIRNEREALVRDAIEHVPELYCGSLVLYYRRRQSVRQVAQLLDLSEDVVKQRLHRGRMMIKEQLSSVVEETLSSTGPKKAFTAAVMASVATLVIKGTGTAVAGVAVASGATGTGAAAVLSGTTAKIITAVAVAVIGVGAVVAYKQVIKPNPKSQSAQTGTVVQEQANERGNISDETDSLSTPHATTHTLDTEESNSPVTKVAQKTDRNNLTTSEANSVSAQSDDNLVVGGIVESEDGKPIADVDVELLWDVKRGSMMMLDGKRTVTDPNGRWECQITGESEDISIRLKHSDYLSQFFDYRPSFDDLLAKSAVLIMTKGLQIFGFVFDIDGYPVPDALIMPPDSITDTDAVYGIQDSAKTTRTDANGYFFLGAVEPGLQDIAIDANGYAPTFIDVNVIPKMPPVEITLDYGKNLTGVVVDVNGQPLPAVTVTADHWQIMQGQNTKGYSRKTFSMLRRRTVTDAAGQYTIEHLPSIGNVEIFFGKRKTNFLSSCVKNDMTQNENKVVTMYPIPTITGTVIDADSGKPITEFEVVAGCTWDPNDLGIWDLNADKITSPLGSFSKTKSNFTAGQSPSTGWVAVKINAKGYLPAQSPWMQVGREFSPITISLKNSKILGSTLFYSDGVAASNTDVILIEPSSWVYVRNGKLNEEILNSEYSVTQTDANGYFEFCAPPAPTKILVLDYDEYLVADTNELKDKLTLTPWAHVTGLVETDNHINSNITVRISSEDDPNEQIRWMSEQTTNVDGRFEFSYIPAIPQKTYYGPPDSTNILNKGPDINPCPNEELELRLGTMQPVDPNITTIEEI
jgi:RNA polymerase sigma factor (sigma-70 family)